MIGGTEPLLEALFQLDIIWRKEGTQEAPDLNKT